MADATGVCLPPADGKRPAISEAADASDLPGLLGQSIGYARRSACGHAWPPKAL
ncbi:hypothetical protein ACVWVY_007180 [Bradyrhizobium sp. URHC0002]